MTDPIIDEMTKIVGKDSHFFELLRKIDGAPEFLRKLRNDFPCEKINEKKGDRFWELSGCYYLNNQRLHEALQIFLGLYRQKLAGQKENSKRAHKGMPLCWIGDAYRMLGFPVHATRYYMLALCEDAVNHKGNISPEHSGVYFRLVWHLGLPDQEFNRYASEIWKASKRGTVLYPEALLPEVDTNWMTSVPSAAEAFKYVVNGDYVRSLVDSFGKGDGKAFECLASYLLSCMPGCRTKLRQRSYSTDYDVVCTMEGFDVDFRSELGRYFVCECKDWKRKADYSTMAKFCRVLDSTKAKFGILFTKNGITGTKGITDAERERLKIYQDRGTVIVVIDKRDLNAIANGVNLISLMRDQYETVRLDLRPLAETTRN